MPVRCLCVCVLGKNLDRERESFKKCMIKCTDWLWVIEYEWLSVHWFGPTSCTTLSSAQTPRPLDTYTHNPIHSIPPDCHPVRKQIMCSHICYYRWKCLNMHAFNDVYLFALQIINTERGGGAALYNEHVSYPNIRCVFAVKHIHAPVFDMCLYIYGIHVFRVGKKTSHNVFLFCWHVVWLSDHGPWVWVCVPSVHFMLEVNVFAINLGKFHEIDAEKCKLSYKLG